MSKGVDRVIPFCKCRPDRHKQTKEAQFLLPGRVHQNMTRGPQVSFRVHLQPTPQHRAGFSRRSSGRSDLPGTAWVSPGEGGEGRCCPREGAGRECCSSGCNAQGGPATGHPPAQSAEGQLPVSKSSGVCRPTTPGGACGSLPAGVGGQLCFRPRSGPRSGPSQVVANTTTLTALLLLPTPGAQTGPERGTTPGPHRGLNQGSSLTISRLWRCAPAPHLSSELPSPGPRD